MKQKKQYIIIFILLCIIITPNIYAALTDGLVGYYSMDNKNTTTIIDDMNYKNLTLTTQTFNTTGIINGSLKFFDSGEIKTWKNYSLAATNKYTFNLWMKDFDEKGGFEGIISDVIDNTCDIGITYEGTGSNNRLDFFPNNAVTTSYVITNLTGWHMVTATYNGTMGILYFDGVNVSNISTAVSTCNDNLTIGADRNLGGRYYQGHLDEIGIWNRTLNSTEIQQLRNGGLGITYPFINTFSAYSNYNSSNITDFCLTITNTTYNSTTCTTSGTITNVLLGTYNLSINNISSGIYKEINITNYNITAYKNFIFYTYLTTQNNTYITTAFNRASIMKSFIVNASYTNTTNITDFSIDVSCNGGTQYAYNVTLGIQTNCQIEGQYLQYRVTFYPNSTNQPTITQINISMFDDLVSTGGGSGGGGGGSPYVNPYSNLPQVQNGFNVQTLIKYILYPVEFFSIDAYAWMMPYNTYFFIIKEGRLTGFALWVIVALVLFIMTRKY